MENNEYQPSYTLIPIKGKDGEQGSQYANGLYFNYRPEFLNASLNASCINDRSMRNTQNNIYNAKIDVPISDSGFTASYGVDGYYNRYSSPYFSQTYQAINPMYSINYTNGAFNAFLQKQQGQSPYFGFNYSKQF